MNPFKEAKDNAARAVADAAAIHGMAVDNYGQTSEEAATAAKGWRQALNTAYANGATDDDIRKAARRR